MRHVAFGVLVVVLFAASALSQERRPGTVELSPLPGVTTASGQSLAVEKGRLFVPENRRKPNSRVIELAFGRLKSTSKNPGPPIIYLHGGPGGSATGAVRNPRAMSMWAPFLKLGDVILLDQRGCGRSVPALARKMSEPAPPAAFTDISLYEKFLASATRRVKSELESESIDITGYDTEQSADDIDALRAALGAQEMRLVGFSYGTHLGLSVIRRHGARVESAVLIGVEGPSDTVKFPNTYEVQLAKIAALVARDPAVGDDVPDFVGLLRTVLEKLKKTPMVVSVFQPITRKRVAVAVGPDFFKLILVRDLGDTNDLPVFPRLLHSINAGDSSLLRWFVQKRYGRGIYPTHAFTMDPASGCPPARAARIAAEAKTTVLGTAMNFAFPAVEAIWNMPILGEDFRAPIVTDVRTLFLSGTFDANTPPYQAEQVRWGFTRSTHLIQQHGGHEDWLRNRKVPPVLLDFLAGKSVAGRDVDMPPLRFIPVRGRPTGVTHPAVSN